MIRTAPTAERPSCSVPLAGALRVRAFDGAMVTRWTVAGTQAIGVVQINVYVFLLQRARVHFYVRV